MQNIKIIKSYMLVYNVRMPHICVKSGGRKVKPCKWKLFYPIFWGIDGGKEDSYLQFKRSLCKNMKTTKNVYHLYVYVCIKYFRKHI